MLKKTLIILGSSFFLFIIFGSSFATVNVNIGINVPPPPPPLLLPAPPDVFVIPGTYAYFPPGLCRHRLLRWVLVSAVSGILVPIHKL